MDDATVELGIADLTDGVEVGAGGFGTVYKAHQESLRRDVAVKVVSNTVKDEKVRIRFEREIQAMGMLSGHPNIVTVYDSGFTGKGQPYILMDYMEQGSLGDRLEQSGPLPYTDVLSIMVKVCGALETAHQAGILHRDLKPENVLVSAYGEPKLGDFGIARLKGGPETGTASLTASIEHVAPELLEAKPPSAASDLYALGSTMYKLLTGGAAFVRPTDESIVPALARIRDEPLPDMRQRGIPAPVAAVVERAMAKQDDQRYASASEMGRALREVQRQLGLPQTAMPVREEEAAAARESTRTINSDDLARSIDDLRGQPPGPPAPFPSAASPGMPAGPPPAAPAAPGGPGMAYRAQPMPGYHASGGQPPGAAGPTGPPQGFTGGYSPQTPPPRGNSTPWPKVLAGVGALALVAVVGVALALTMSGDDAQPDPVPTPVVSEPDTRPATEAPTEPTATAPTEYASFERLLDESGRITVDVPRPWTDVDSGPWVIDGAEVGPQIEAAPDLEGFRTSWNTPGVIFGVSEQLRSSYDPAGLLDALDFGEQCTYEGREAYTDPAYTGFRDDYSGCGGTDTTYAIIAAEPETQDRVLLVQFQAVDARDDAALETVLNTFFELPSDDATQTPEATEGQ